MRPYEAVRLSIKSSLAFLRFTWLHLFVEFIYLNLCVLPLIFPAHMVPIIPCLMQRQRAGIDCP